MRQLAVIKGDVAAGKKVSLFGSDWYTPVIMKGSGVAVDERLSGGGLQH